MISTTLIENLAELEALVPEWEALLEKCAFASPTLSPLWMLPWWQVFGGDGRRRLKVVTFRDDGRLVGLAPLLSRPHVYRRALRFRRLELMASGEEQSDEICSDYIGVIAESGCELQVAAALARSLDGKMVGRWDELILSPMNGESPLTARLADALGARGFSVTTSDADAAPYVTLPASWDAYLASLPSGHRAYIRKSIRGFEKWAGGRPELVTAANPSQLAEAQRVLIALHRERWNGGGVFESARYSAFHERVIPALFARGALDLGWLAARGQPVAAFYNIVWGGKIYFYQSGRTLAAPSDARVGVVMHAYLLQSAIERGLREYDFLGGPARYKMAFAEKTRPLVTLRAVRPSLLETARRFADYGIDRLRVARDQIRARAPSLFPPAEKPTPKPEV